jgi:hypothetical protein
MSLLDHLKEEQRRKAQGLADPPPPRASFATRTGQAGRLSAARWVSIVGGLLMFAGWARSTEPYAVSLLLWGTFVGVVGFVWQCLAVRCPKCRVAVVWHTFNTRKVSEAEAAALHQETCPRCGYDPA